jgi:hypothetical protein
MTSQIKKGINKKKNGDLWDTTKMCHKSKFFQTIITYFNDFSAKVRSSNGFPNHNTCHIGSLSLANSQSACNCILNKAGHHPKVLLTYICVCFNVLGKPFKFVVECCEVPLATKIVGEFNMLKPNHFLQHGPKPLKVKTS